VNQKQFFVPRGFAHGFLVLSETATFFYKCDNFYNKESEGGIIYNDKSEATFANYRKIVMDFMYKYKGFAIVGEYVNGNVTGKDLYTNASKTNKLKDPTVSLI
jgi:hypothetical protein